MEIERELELLRESWTETFDQLFVLYEVAHEVSSVLELDEILEHIVNHAFLLLESEAACVFLVDKDAGQLDLKVVKDEKGRETKPGIHLKIGEGIAGDVASSRKPVIITSQLNETQFKSDSVIFGIAAPRNLMCVPITLRGGETIGVIEVINRKNRTFNTKDRDFLMAIANISALSIENAKIYKKLKSNELFYTQAIENLPEGFLAVSSSGKIIQMNSGARKLLGLEGTDNFEWQPFAEVLREETEVMKHLSAALQAGKTKKWHEISLMKTGKPVFLFTFVFWSQDNSVLGAGAILQDMVLKRG